MPSKTPKQKSFMAAVANNPKFAKKVGVPSKVGKEFEMKDKKMGMKKMADKAGRAMTKKSPDTMGRAMKKYAEGGSVSSRADGIAKKGKTDTKMPKMAMGGIGRNLSSSGAPINMNPTQTGSGSTGQLIGSNLSSSGAPINMNPTQTGSGSTGQLKRMAEVGRAGAIGSKLSSMGRAGAMTRPRGGIQRKKGGSC
jgi:hypothetical protein